MAGGQPADPPPLPPTSGSWLNLVGSGFGIIERQATKRPPIAADAAVPKAKGVTGRPECRGGQRAGCHALQQPGGNQRPEVWAEPASALVNTNIDGPIRNIAPSPKGLAETPAGYQRQAEGQCVAEYHPLCGGRCDVEVSLDRRQRHVDDTDVEQGHEHGRSG